MKKVILEVTTCELNGKEVALDYRTALIGLISNPVDGMKLDQMRNIERVYDKLIDATSPGSVVLEDAEHATLCGCLKTAQFRVFDKGILNMVESSLSAEDVSTESYKFGGKHKGES